MGEEKIKKVKVEDLPKPEQELTSEEAKKVSGGAAESASKGSATQKEQLNKDPLRSEQADKGA